MKLLATKILIYLHFYLYSFSESNYGSFLLALLRQVVVSTAIVVAVRFCVYPVVIRIQLKPLCGAGEVSAAWRERKTSGVVPPRRFAYLNLTCTCRQ